MHDTELHKRFDLLEAHIGVLASTVADLQTLTWELMAQQMAFGTVMRESLPQDKAELRLRLVEAYRKAQGLLLTRRQSWQKSDDVRPPLDIPPILPDETDN